MGKKASLAELLNDLTFWVTYNRLKLLALNIFKWEDLPEGIKPEYIEKLLYTHGQALFFKDPLVGFMCLQAATNGQLNVYGEPVKFRAIGIGYNEEYDIDNSVLIRNNMLKTNTHDALMMYTNKIVEVERTTDVHISNIKFPFIAKCDEKDRLTVKNMFKQVQANEPAIYVDKSMSANPFEVFNTDQEFWADKLADYRHDIWNEVLTFLGINNANTDKKERLITDEVNANNEFVSENVQHMLEMRQQACEQINKMFGLNISVSVRLQEEREKQEEEAEAAAKEEKEGDEE